MTKEACRVTRERRFVFIAAAQSQPNDPMLITIHACTEPKPALVIEVTKPSGPAVRPRPRMHRTTAISVHRVAVYCSISRSHNRSCFLSMPWYLGSPDSILPIVDRPDGCL
jgi:hypothetical protein